MKKILNNFIQELKSNQKLKDEFTKCKSLKESFNRFMKGKCSYEEYESFFKDLIQKQTHLSDQDLEQVAGGKGLGKILLPVTIVTMLLTGASAMSASAYEPGVQATSSNSVTSIQQNDKNEGDKQQNTKQNDENSDQAFVSKLAKLGYTCTVNEGGQSVTISSKRQTTLDQKIFDIIIAKYPNTTIEIGPGITELNIGPNDTMDLNFKNAKDLKSISVDKQNERYSTDGILLYVNDQGIKRAIYSIPEGKICDGKIKFVDTNYSIYVEGTNNEKPCALDLSIFDEYIKQSPYNTIIEIGPGIESINLDDQDIDISRAFDLKTINLSENNKKYKVVDKHLYSVDHILGTKRILGLIDKKPIYDFGLDMIDTLPKLENGKKFEEIGTIDKFKPFLKLIDFEEMKSDLINSRLKELNAPKLSKAEITKIENQIKEKKETYEKIRQVVEELKEKVERRTPKEGTPKKDEIKEGGIYSKHYQMDKNWRVAKAIYRWVAKNISYDNDSTWAARKKSGQERKPQDPFFVFENKIGLCEGYSRLINQMMRMAGIPSLEITTIRDKSYDEADHAYNAIYLPDSSNKESGWVLLDSTWGSPNQDANELSVVETAKLFWTDETKVLDDSQKAKLKKFFPSFYSENKNLKDDNEKIIKLLSHKIQYFLTETESMAGEDIDDTYSVSSEDFIFRVINSVNDPMLRVDAKKLNGQPNPSSTELKISDIPEKLLKSKIPIVPVTGIKTLNLGESDNVEILKLNGSDLESINVDKNNKRYFADEIALWEKNDNNEPDKIHTIIKKDGSYEDGEYQINYSIKTDKNYIQLEGTDIDFEKLPASLKLIGKKYRLPFYIKNCTGSLHLGPDDNFNLAFDDSFKPTSINVDKNNRQYFTDEFGLWQKDYFSNKPKWICIKEEGSCGEGEDEVKYKINQRGIELEGKNIDVNILPAQLKLMSQKHDFVFYIKNCTGSLHLGPDDDFDFFIIDNVKPKSIAVDKGNKRYFADEFGLWSKDAWGKPKNIKILIKKEGSCGEGEDEVKYTIDENKIELEGKNINFNILPEKLKLISKKCDLPFYLKNCTGSFKLGKDDDYANLILDESFNPTSVTIHPDNPKYKVKNNAICEKKTGNPLPKFKN